MDTLVPEAIIIDFISKKLRIESCHNLEVLIQVSIYNAIAGTVRRPKNDKYQLCIPSSMEKEIFQIAYDNNVHERKGRAIERIQKSFYIHYLNSHLDIYIWYCFDYEHNQICWHKPYRELNPIKASSHSFQTIDMNWILSLLII